MRKISNNFHNLSRPTQRAFWMTVVVGTALLLFGIQLFREIIDPYTSTQVRIADSIPIFLSLVAFLSASLILIGKPNHGAWLFFGAIIIGLFIAPVLAEGYGFACAALVILVALFLPSQVLTGKQSSLSLLAGFITSLLIIIIDTFLPGPFTRISASDTDVQTANILTGILLALILIGLALQYRHYSLKTKLIISFLGFAIISVGIVSVQSMTINSRYLTLSIGNQIHQAAQSNALVLGNELNRVVNILSSISFSVSLQDEIRNSMQDYPETNDEIQELVQNLDIQWKENLTSDRNSALIYDRITNRAAIELRVLSYRIPNLGNTFVVNRYGALVGSLTTINQYNFSREAWWDDVYNNGNGAVYIGLPTYDYDLKGTSILLAVPVFDRIGNYFIGAVGTKISFDGYEESLKQAAKLLGKKAGISLVFLGEPPLELGTPEIQVCNSNGLDPIGFQVGIDTVFVVVSKDNTFLTNITKDQLRNIFSTGEKWSDIDPTWPDEAIIRYIPTSESGTFDFFVNSTLNGDLSAIMNLPYLHQTPDERDYLGKVADDPYSIGITGGGYFKEFQDKLSAVSIDGNLPDPNHVEIGEYFLTRPLFLYTSSKILREKPQISGFINYYLNHANEVTNKIGYFPPSEESLNQSKSNWMKSMGVSEMPEINPESIQGDITVAGSSTVFLLTREIADRFIKDGYKGIISLDSSETGLGIKQLCLMGTIDIADASRKINDNPRTSVQDYLLETIEMGKNYTYFEQDFSNSKSLVSTVPVVDSKNSEYISKMDWVLVAYNPIEDALAPIQTQKRASIAILLVIGIVSTVGALGLAQLLANPLQRLSIAARKFGAGELSIRAPVESHDEIGNLATAFNAMADQIRGILDSLENQVTERSQAVVVSAEISRKLSTILNQQQLVLMVVEEIRRSYNFYHAHIYLYDSAQRNLVMVGGTGDAGRTMMERGHIIEPGQGLVGRCAKTNSLILVSDTSTDPSWLSNPLLPETRSEVAVPIAIGENVLGVLDVQHNIPSGINQKTAELLQAIANQVAVALQNAQLFEKAQNQADQEAIIIDINQKIQKTTSIEEVLEITAREIGVALGANKASVSIQSKHFRNIKGNPGLITKN